jgi:DNA-binding MarR family transcriptional regulator
VRDAKSANATDVLDLENDVCFHFAVAARRVIALYRPLLDPLHLTLPQYLVMVALWELEPLSVRQLSQRVQLDPQTLSPLLRRLEALGYVVRQRDQHDKRNLNVGLSAKGCDLRQQALKIPPAVMDRLGMSADQLETLNAMLTEVIRRAHRPEEG